jgi:hypothetical protein
MTRIGACVLVALVAGCDGDWEADVTEYYSLRCAYQERCATSSAGLDCEAYVDQLVVRADPCTLYDDYYIDACLTQLREYIAILDEDRETCPEGVEGGAPACTQAFVATPQGSCNPPE